MAATLTPRDDIHTLDAFKQVLLTNPGMVVLKFSATWCGPCKRIADQVEAWFQRLSPATTQVVVVDIDESLDLYMFLKNKKMLNGVPALLMYKKGNLNYVPDDSVNNSNPLEVDEFFKRILAHQRT